MIYTEHEAATIKQIEQLTDEAEKVAQQSRRMAAEDAQERQRVRLEAEL